MEFIDEIQEQFFEQIKNRYKEIHELEMIELDALRLKFKEEANQDEMFDKYSSEMEEICYKYDRKRIVLKRCSVACSCGKNLRFRNWYKHTKQQKAHMNKHITLTFKGVVTQPTLIFYNDD